MRSFASDAHKTPAFAFEMRLSCGIVLRTTGKVVHGAINLNRNACFANGEVHCVSADFMLTHDVYAFCP